ncbi:MAG TPA: DNA polymerase III subunit delta [Bacteroidota bacterium]
MTHQELHKAVASKQFAPVYLVYGAEDLLAEECMNAIVENAVDEDARGFNLDIMYGSRDDTKDVVAHASSFPMMRERRVVVVKEFEKLATTEAAQELLSGYFKKPMESTTMVLLTSKPDFRKKLFLDLKKSAQLIECKPLFDNQAPDWIEARIKKMGKSVSPEAVRLLHAYVGNSLRVIQSEIDKLFIFIGDKKQIEVEDVAGVVGETKGYTVFELQNAVGKRDISLSMQILERMLELGESPQLMIVMLTRFFTQLYKLSELKQRRATDQLIASELGIKPYYVKQYVAFSANFSNEHIEQNFRALLDADVTLKSTSRDQRLVMDLLIYSLVKGTAQLELMSA